MYILMLQTDYKPQEMYRRSWSIVLSSLVVDIYPLKGGSALISQHVISQHWRKNWQRNAPFITWRYDVPCCTRITNKWPADRLCYCGFMFSNMPSLLHSGHWLTIICLHGDRTMYIMISGHAVTITLPGLARSSQNAWLATCPFQGMSI